MMVPDIPSPICVLHPQSHALNELKEMYSVGEVKVVPKASIVLVVFDGFVTVVPFVPHELAPVVVTGQ
jgi:hypothetical protein